MYAMTGSLSGSSIMTTATGSASLTTTTTTFATSAKDSATATGVTGVTAGGHTHAVTLPSGIVHFIIKT